MFPAVRGKKFPKFSAGSDIRSRPACKLAAVSEICSHLQTQRSWARKQVDLHGTSSRPEDLGRVAWKIPSRNTHKKFKAKINRERGKRYEFPTWGAWARRLKYPHKKLAQKIQSENSSRRRHTARVPELTTELLWHTAESGKITSAAAAVSLPQHKSSRPNTIYRVNVLNLPHRTPNIDIPAFVPVWRQYSQLHSP